MLAILGLLGLVTTGVAMSGLLDEGMDTDDANGEFSESAENEDQPHNQHAPDLLEESQHDLAREDTFSGNQGADGGGSVSEIHAGRYASAEDDAELPQMPEEHPGEVPEFTEFDPRQDILSIYYQETGTGQAPELIVEPDPQDSGVTLVSVDGQPVARMLGEPEEVASAIALFPEPNV
ncbi:hypothetical protein SAMN05421688_2396 [Poseidonocella pacifica]|uniref:Uncharacterized protein n=1 Tax=Poseidonocella pacifica TaxID=871651 RepID=A0A1I0XNR7_9RHOB|nr:hypothetical protein [Poseidonocella pacifica]SFB01603.1 hypothetical protein SAMN05421688_2396 [Poseidonocella pacifica]